MSPHAPLPRNALTLVDAPRLKLLHLMALAVYEREGPMTYQDIRDRLLLAGVDRPISSLQKAWHGRPMLRKSRDGHFHLDLEDSDWTWVELVVSDHLGLFPRDATSSPPRLKLVPRPGAQPSANAEPPLTALEVDLALRDGLRGEFSLRRCLIAIADSAGRPLQVDEALVILHDSGPGRVTPIDIERSVRGRAGPLTRDAEGCLVVDPAHADIEGIRRAVRERAAKAAERQQADQERHANAVEWHAREADERAGRQAWYVAANKLVLRAVFNGDRLVAAAVLDPDTRRIEEFRDAADLRARLEQADLVLGLDPWSDLAQLDVPAEGRALIDLSPPQKTRRIDQRGRTLKLTPSLLIGATLQAANPLGDDDALRQQCTHGEHAKVRRRLEADLKALWRFYEYGRLHGFVCLRWGFLDELVGVNWNVGGLPTVREVLAQALEEERWVEIVLGAAPGWSDPWSRGRTCRVVGVDWDHASFEGHGGPVEVGFEEIAALRLQGEG